MKRLVLFFAILASLTSLSAQQEPALLPLPQQVVLGEGSYVLKAQATIYTNLSGKAKKDFVKYLQQSTFANQRTFTVVNKESRAEWRFLIRPEVAHPGHYVLDANPKGLSVVSPTVEGLFYGLQTALQLANNGKDIKAVHIEDEPRFPYRGMMLDVSRHFFSVEFIKKQLDVMAYYKMNRFHWHLTDGPGWRIEIKKYPRLTEFAAWRDKKSWKEWWNGGRKYTTQEADSSFGGYYTQKQIREVVAYAAARQITIIPEIEIPGHSEEVLAAYPFLSCADEAYKNSDFCAGKDSVFQFLENVLTEVMDLFPSEYIHIGGDEAGKEAWKTCPYCRARMEKEGLQDVNGLQSYFVNRIGKFLESKGRHLLGWDELMDGTLPENAAIMSWRGEEGGINAMKSGHPAIMTPGQYCYLDFYQDVPHLQPEAIGGFTPLKKVYSYEPVSPLLTSEEATHLLGVQGNLWTEFVPTPEHAEMMLYPRILALAEVGWTASSRKSWPNFYNRALEAIQLLQDKGYHPFDLQHEIGDRPESLTKIQHLAIGKKVVYQAPYNSNYAAGGDSSLTDGWRGGWSFVDKRWQGFISAKRLDVTIDLDSVQDLHSIEMICQQQVGPEIYLPAKVTYAVSENGTTYQELFKSEKKPDLSVPVCYQEYKWTGNVRARFVQVTARATPEHGGWVFTDELILH